VRNVGKLKLQVHPGMLKGSSLEVNIFSALKELKTVKFDFMTPNNTYILRRFEETGDRRIPYICQVEIDVASELGVRKARKDD
jgi:hypothetical protein